MASQFSSLSLGQLMTELRKRNANFSERKKELIER
jgi:predicted HTH domain antitoxin